MDGGAERLRRERGRRHGGLVRPAVDAGMALAYLLQMIPGKMGNTYHELAGIVLVLLFVVHHLLNRGWLGRLSRRTGMAWRLMLAGDLALLVCMAGAAVTGVLMSRAVLPTLVVPGVAHVARPLHGMCAYLGLMLVALHSGLHVPALRAYVGPHALDARLGKQGRLGKRAFAVGAALAVAGGTWAAMRLGVATKLMGGLSFPDAVTPAWLQLAEHVLLACPFALLGAWVEGRQRSDHRKEGD